jgi:hypothetical protein
MREDAEAAALAEVEFEAATRREKSLRLRQERLDEQERQKRADQFNAVKARAKKRTASA